MTVGTHGSSSKGFVWIKDTPQGLQRFLHVPRPMSLRFTRHVVGLDIGSRAIKLIQLEKKHGRFSLRRFGMKRLEGLEDRSGRGGKRDTLIAAIKELVQSCGITCKHVAIALSGASVMVKRIDLPPMPDHEIEPYITWEGHQYVPYSFDEVYWDFQILPSQLNQPGGGVPRSLLLVAAKKESVEQWIVIVRGAGLVPMVLDVEGCALSNMYAMTHQEKTDEMVLLVNIGAEKLNMTVVNQGIPVLMRDASVGGVRYEEVIVRRRPSPDEEIDHMLFQSQQDPSLEKLFHMIHADMLAEIKRMIEYFAEQSWHGQIQRIVLYGGYARVAGLLKMVQTSVSVPVEQGNPFEGIGIPASITQRHALLDLAPLAAVGIGLACRKIGDR